MNRNIKGAAWLLLLLPVAASSQTPSPCAAGTLTAYLNAPCTVGPSNQITLTVTAYSHVEFGGAAVITSDEIAVTPGPGGLRFEAGWKAPQASGLEDLITLTSQAAEQRGQSLRLAPGAVTGNAIADVTDEISYSGGVIGNLFLVDTAGTKILAEQNGIAPTGLPVTSLISIGLNGQSAGSADVKAVAATFQAQ
ncbi:MAG TPA: hypothetical protein VGR84_19210 [Candidatus Acidoferrales bacterium]|nr:hypothetical protein [Candidatus Acidoferrales bacterium]